MIFDTICAIATPYGTGGISVIRVSGNDAITEVNKIFKGSDLTKAKSHTVTYGFIIDSDGNKIDEVLVTIMKGKKSFTGEDTAEISTHGGILVTNKVLARILSTGIRLAERGEFTQRAFLNGRIDLIQAESINDLIHAKNDSAIKIANQGLNKKTSELIIEMKEYLLDLIAKIEVNIDYPEYDDAEVMTNEIIIPKVKGLLTDISGILKYSKKTMMIKEGIKTAIIGKPNVGKSSLLNALTDSDKAIVTEIPGTTRDLVEAYVNLEGISLNLIDTAGIRESTDKVESIGIERSKKAIKEAELVLLVLDQSENLTEEDQRLLEITKDKPRIIVLNKADLKNKIKIENSVSISSKEKTGLMELEKKIIEVLLLSDIQNTDYNYLSNARQIGLLEKALETLENIMLNKHLPVDLLVIDLTKAYHLLLEILGEEYRDNLLNELFSKFCLGK